MLPFESAPVTDSYCMTTRQDFETTVLTLSFWEGHGKQLVSPRGKKKKIKPPLRPRRKNQGLGGSEHTELASGEDIRQWLEEMWQEAEAS